MLPPALAALSTVDGGEVRAVAFGGERCIIFKFDNEGVVVSLQIARRSDNAGTATSTSRILLASTEYLISLSP